MLSLMNVIWLRGNTFWSWKVQKSFRYSTSISNSSCDLKQYNMLTVWSKTLSTLIYWQSRNMLFILFLFFSVLTELNSPQTQTRHKDRKQRDTDQTTASTSDTMNEPERGSAAEGYVQTGHQVWWVRLMNREHRTQVSMKKLITTETCSRERQTGMKQTPFVCGNLKWMQKSGTNIGSYEGFNWP